MFGVRGLFFFNKWLYFRLFFITKGTSHFDASHICCKIMGDD